MKARIALIGAVAGAGLLACGAATALANQIQVVYSVAAGATSAPIAVPAINTPVSVTCVQNTDGFRGVGQMTLQRVYPTLNLKWIGIDIALNAGGGATSSGGNTTIAGTHMIYCDFVGSLVDIQVQSGTSIQVKNTSGTTATGVINFVW